MTSLRRTLENQLGATPSVIDDQIDFATLRPTTLRLPNRDSNPSGEEGLVYYNTVTKQLMAYVDGAWSHVVDASILDAKGDLLVATGADAIARLPVGADGTFLTADASQPGGMKWDTPPPGVPQGKMLWTPGPHPYRAGAWYAAADTESRSVQAASAGIIHYVGPFYVSQSFNVDRIGFNASTASGNVRLALFSATALGLPGSLVVESADTAVVSSINAVTVTSTALTANTFYYLAAQFSTGGATVDCYASPDTGALVPHAGFNNPIMGMGNAQMFQQSQAYGAFPASATPAVAAFGTLRPILFVRTV